MSGTIIVYESQLLSKSRLRWTTTTETYS
uniref:Uncharacterized protein n=1 Tax=Rhizophora mucronata TaxID=61149 RepID=A0A2P2NXI4_RHIMU